MNISPEALEEIAVSALFPAGESQMTNTQAIGWPRNRDCLPRILPSYPPPSPPSLTGDDAFSMWTSGSSVR